MQGSKIKGVGSQQKTTKRSKRRRDPATKLEGTVITDLRAGERSISRGKGKEGVPLGRPKGRGKEKTGRPTSEGAIRVWGRDQRVGAQLQHSLLWAPI